MATRSSAGAIVESRNTLPKWVKYITVSKFKKCISSDIRVWVKNGGEDGKKRTRYIPTESFHEATEITFLTEITFFTRDDLDLN